MRSPEEYRTKEGKARRKIRQRARMRALTVLSRVHKKEYDRLFVVALEVIESEEEAKRARRIQRNGSQGKHTSSSEADREA
jgi:hypothetical protein